MTKMTSRSRWASIFYWIGVTLTLASIVLVLLENTTWGSRFALENFPLAWKFAIAAVLALLAGEICHPAFPFNREKDADSRHSLDQNPYEI